MKGVNRYIPNSPYQEMALELLMDDTVPLVIIQSNAGFGKSYLILDATLQKLFQDNQYDKIFLVKPTILAQRFQYICHERVSESARLSFHRISGTSGYSSDTLATDFPTPNSSRAAGRGVDRACPSQFAKQIGRAATAAVHEFFAWDCFPFWAE